MARVGRLGQGAACGASSVEAKGAMATDITPGAPADQPGGAQPSQAKQASAQAGRQPSSRQTASGWATYHRGAVALPWLQERVCASQRFQPGASRLGRRKPRGEQTKRRQQMCRLPSSFSLTAGKGGNPDSDVVRLRHCGDERMESRVSLVIRHRCEGGKIRVKTILVVNRTVGKI